MTGQTFIFMGVQGAGKGTQLSALKSALEAAGRKTLHYDAGATLRQIAESRTRAGDLINERIVNGKLVPDIVTGSLLFNTLRENISSDEAIDVLVDGFPRTVMQARLLDQALAFFKYENPVVVHLTLPREETLTRLVARGRNDDTKEAIERRLAWFETETLPAVEFFRTHENYRVLDLDGNRPIEDIASDVKSYVK